MDKTDTITVTDLEKQETNETDSIIHTKVFRPWGWYICIDGNDHSGYKVKRIGVYQEKDCLCKVTNVELNTG